MKHLNVLGLITTMFVLLASPVGFANPPGGYLETCKNLHYDPDTTELTGDCLCNTRECFPEYGGDGTIHTTFYCGACPSGIYDYLIGPVGKNVCIGTPGRSCYSGYLVCDNPDWELFYPSCSWVNGNSCSASPCRVTGYDKATNTMKTTCSFYGPWGAMNETRERTMSDCHGKMSNSYGEISCGGDRPTGDGKNDDILDIENGAVGCKDNAVCIIHNAGSMYCSTDSVCVYGKQVNCQTRDNAVCRALSEVDKPVTTATGLDNKEVSSGVMVCRDDAICRMTGMGQMFCSERALCRYGNAVACYAVDAAKCEVDQ